MAVRIKDNGDRNDPVKWDFDESNMKVQYLDYDYYPYKANSKKKAEKLSKLRDDIRFLCRNIENNIHSIKNSTSNKEYLNGVELFLNIHKEYMYENPHILPEPFYTFSDNGLPTSRYLLSEIPKGTEFHGLNKPKMRHMSEGVPVVGKDGKGRALYRDIFLNLDTTDEKLRNLIIHELAHTGANHISFVPENHYADFQWFEQLIKRYWPN